MMGYSSLTKNARYPDHQATMLEIDDEAIGLLIEQEDGYHFDATHPAVLSWQGHRFASVGEAQSVLARAINHANDR